MSTRLSADPERPNQAALPVHRCSHCELAIPPADLIVDEIDGQTEYFCCQGCRGAYRIITGSGLGRFYRQRSWQEPGLPPGAFSSAYTDDQLAQAVKQDAAGAQISFLLEGLRCATCVWLNEKILEELEGVLEARVNYGNHRAKVIFDSERTSAAAIFAAVARLGYQPRLLTRHTAEGNREREQRALLIRFGTAFFLSMQLMGYSFALYAGYFQGMDTATRTLLQGFAAVVATPVVFYSGWPFLAGAWRSLRSRVPNMDLLIALGVLAAYGSSLYALITDGEVYFDTAAMIITLILLGRLFENAARHRAASGIDRLLHLVPETAERLTESGEAVSVESGSLLPGDRIRVRPGDRFPTDGRLVSGETEVDQAAATGEPLPQFRAASDQVLAGTLNLTSPVTVAVEKAAAESFVARVAALVEEAQLRRAPIQRYADRIAAAFVPLVLAIAAFTWLYWTLRPPTGISPILAAVAVLVVACPCALGLATPTAVLVASGAAAGRGILFRGGDVLEATGRVTHVCFDKTGTLTLGAPTVTQILPTRGSTDDLLRLAAALERESRHPLALGICREAELRGLPVIPATEVQTLPGRGLLGRIEGQTGLAGSRRLLADHGVAMPAHEESPQAEVHLALEGEYLGLIRLEDLPRPKAGAVIAALRRMGLHTMLLTGDSSAAGTQLAKHLGVEKVHAGLTPAEKSRCIEHLQQAGATVLMVGDGINDAPALARADVGCAMAGGTDIALDNSDLVLTRPALARIAEGLVLGRRALRVIRQNLFWAFIYNLAALPLAASGRLAPIHAAAAMALSSVCVVGNSLRLRRAAGSRGQGGDSSVSDADD